MSLTIDGQANSITSSTAGVNIPATVDTLSVGPSGSYMIANSSGIAATSISATTIASTNITTTQVLNTSGKPILNSTGSILQVSWKDLGFSSFTATSTSATYRATGFTNTITPGNTSSKILHIVTIGCQFICDGNIVIARGGTVVSPSLMDSYRDGITTSYTVDMPAYTFTFLDSPATTSAISYELYCRAGGCSGTMYVGSSGDATSSWTLMEVSA